VAGPCTDERIGSSPCVAATNGATSVGQKENRGSGEREGCPSLVVPFGAGASGKEARNGFCWIVVENAGPLCTSDDSGSSGGLSYKRANR
jgi:hypothetical protein